MHNRKNALQLWLEKTLRSTDFTLIALTGDASFRRYLRLHHENKNYIVMDAPPEKEPLGTFLSMGAFLRKNNLHAPEVIAVDQSLGFALLEDFGDDLLLDQLTPSSANTIYQLALLTLIQFQQCPPPFWVTPFNKAFMLKELDLFKEWFLEKYLHLTLTSSQNELVNETQHWLVNEIIKQPQVLIHRDFHSRNLMILEDEQLGIIDFQDAMVGPITYDLVSLLKDCYIQWPKKQINEWVSFFYQHSPLAKQSPFSEFIYAFELCGLQRHLKVLGVFSRLHIRDNKSNYLNDLPLTLRYILDCVESYKELEPFYCFMQQVQLP